MKKIIPTICMSLLGLSAIATSSYAWFSMNKTVTASGMSVKARAEGGIRIKRTAIPGASAGWGSSTSVSSDVQSILPTSTADAVTWLHAEGTSEDNGSALNEQYQPLEITKTAPTESSFGNGHVGTTNPNYYYVYDTYTVASDENSGDYTGLYVSDVSLGESEINNELSSSLRVLIKSETATLVCAPVEGATLGYDVGGTSGTHVTAINSYSATTSIIVAGPTSTADISVYVYFEGEDPTLKTKNIKEVFDELAITVEFKATSVAAK